MGLSSDVVNFSHKSTKPVCQLNVHRTLTQMRNLLIPSPQKCLGVINEMLPILSKKRVDNLIAEAQEAQFKLEFVPSNTVEYVQTLTFLDEIQVSLMLRLRSEILF